MGLLFQTNLKKMPLNDFEKLNDLNEQRRKLENKLVEKDKEKQKREVEKAIEKYTNEMAKKTNSTNSSFKFKEKLKVSPCPK